jgi:hypothetical protein
MRRVSPISFNEELNQKQQEFYASNPKNMFLKKKQKIECARLINSQYNLEELITKSIYNIENTNSIFVDYEILKIFLTDDNTNSIVGYFMFLIEQNIKKYGEFNMHINLNSLTISGVERYKLFVIEFCNKSMASEYPLIEIMNTLYVYNTPNVMENIVKILKPFLNELIHKKVIYHTKHDSPQLIEQLLSDHSFSGQTIKETELSSQSTNL